MEQRSSKHYWKTLGIVLSSVVPAAISGFAGYKQSQVEAAAGYSTLADEVEKLHNEHDRDHDMLIALDARSRVSNVCQPVEPRQPALPPEERIRLLREKRTIPPTLNEAYQLKK